MNPSWIQQRMSAGDKLVGPAWQEQHRKDQLHLGMVSLRCESVLWLLLLQLNVLNNVSSSEDVKPLPGLPGMGNMNYPSTSPGSLAKHICAICGDRSSGRRFCFLGRALCKACAAVNSVEAPWGHCKLLAGSGCLYCRLVPQNEQT